jgi:RimJ/RimL family protein N-acetyltransferase
MQDPSLQATTASEPLTIDQEYAMQKSWREDADKLTFIACFPPDELFVDDDGNVVLQGGEDDVDGEERMVGDVNLFLSESEDDGEEGLCVGEVEIMVARIDLQGKGIGTAILLTFLWYVLNHLEGMLGEYSKSLGKAKVMKYLRVKIDAENERSIKLFERVGFKKVSEKPNYFNELELRYGIPKEKECEEVAKVLNIEEPKVALYQLSSS